MNKILFFLACFFILTGQLYSQNVGKIENDTLINYVDINNNKQGKWVKRYDNGQIKYKGSFVNDKPVDSFFYYYPNGKMKSVLNYDESGNSAVEMYWENGNNYAKGYYTPENERDKQWRIFYEDGSEALVINYINGEVEGMVVMYYPGENSKVMEVNYKNGKLEGEYKKYFTGNRMQETGTCVNGLRHGYWKFYNPEGIIEEEGNYVNGKREGKWIIYDKETLKNDSVNYKNDIPDNQQEMMEKLREQEKFAKENQHLFKQPEDYFDNPIEFFQDSK